VAVVGVALPEGFEVLVVGPLGDELDDCGAIDVPGADVSVVVPVEPVLDGLVVLEAARFVVSLPPRSPG
jgi:hypothetical protein